MIRNARVLTDSRYAEHTSFWEGNLSRLDGDFHFRQNWHSYALSDGGAIELNFDLGPEARRTVRDLSAGSDAAAFVILLGAVYHALHLYTGAAVICVDSPLLNGAARGGYDSQVPLIGEVEPGLTLEAYLDRVRRAVADSYTYQDFPISAVWETLLKRGSQARTNVFAWCPTIHERLEASDAYDLVAEINVRPELRFVLRGRPAVFSQPYLENFGRHVGNILSQYGELQRPLADISAVDEAERERLLNAHAGTVGHFPPGKTIPELFYARADEAPDRIAVINGDAKTTYRELNEASNGLAQFLREQFGIQQGDAVGLFFDRSELSVIGLLAILKAGAVYLPLDPEYPPERLRFMAADADVKALLIHSDQLPSLSDLSDIPMFALDIQLPTLKTSSVDGAPPVYENLPAYIIYTSGSTGKPKGVVLEHRGLVNTVLHHINAFGVGPADRLSQFYSASFDSSLFEIFVALLSGATLVLVPKGTIGDPKQFASYIESQGVTMLTAPPVYLSTLDRAKLSSVKKIVSAGDNARLEDAMELARTRSYYNSYGPTETSICVTHYCMDKDVHYGARIPVGKPITNTYIYLLDEKLALVPEGCIGEICVGGVALARGYLNRDDITRQAFVANPFVPGERLYRTGDLGVWLPDGNLELVGRKDTQVKIRGYRIELGEIESILSQHPNVREAVVLAREDRPGDKRLFAYVTLTRPASVAELRDHLKKQLPEFMLPSAFVTLADMPVTANGKIDRKALPALQPTEERAAREAPQNEIQQRLSEIWKEALGVQEIGINDNFFEMGGDSILIIQMVSQAAKYGLKLTPQQVFEHQTIAALADVAGNVEAVRAEQGMISGQAPLLPMQKWFFLQQIEEKHHYNQSVMLEVPANLKTELLRDCLKHLLAHHDALRSRFLLKEGKWAQEIVAEQELVPFSVADLSRLPAEERGAEIEKQAARLQASLDLTNGPLIRVQFFRLGSAEARLLFIIHHLVVDGVSWRVLLEDFYTAYEQKLRGDRIQLPPKTTSTREWASRLGDYASSLESEFEYWSDEARAQAGGIPVDYDREANQTGSDDEVVIGLSQPETHALLQEAPRAYNTQINDILLTALALTLKEWAGHNCLLIDLEAHGREDLFPGVDLSRTVGWLTATYPALLWIDQSDPGMALRSVKEQLRQIPRHGIGYGLLRYSGDQGERFASQPQAEIVFNYLGQAERMLGVGGDWRPVVGANGGERTTRSRRCHLLEVNGIVISGELRLAWAYSRKVHSAETIERLAGRYMETLRSLITHCCSVEVGGYTPSDFPAARIDQKSLDLLMGRINRE
jgi:amino acid adenylation domain-containing protein/non-ribosomal peptide synthase protein (TIGR01720 family)